MKEFFQECCHHQRGLHLPILDIDWFVDGHMTLAYVALSPGLIKLNLTSVEVHKYQQ